MTQQSSFFESYFKHHSSDIPPSTIDEAIEEFTTKFSFPDAAKTIHDIKTLAISNPSFVNEKSEIDRSDSIAILQYTERLLFYLDKLSN